MGAQSPPSAEIAAVEKLHSLLAQAVEARIPKNQKEKFGLLFSGGLDSLLIAKLLKEHCRASGCIGISMPASQFQCGQNFAKFCPRDFTCYTAVASENSPDLLQAKKAAALLGLKLKCAVVPESETENCLRQLIPLLADPSVVKAGVSLAWFCATRLAREDDCPVLFTGSGADELFAGYARYQKVSPGRLNAECETDVRPLCDREASWDALVPRHFGVKLETPFLDKELVAFALALPPELKIKSGTGKSAPKAEKINKYILRQLALKLGIPKELALARKKAAQYGSGFDKALEKLARKSKCKSKSEYLRKFLPAEKAKIKLGCLISSGKDGLFAAYLMQQQGYPLSCAITLQSANPDSYMFHTPNVHLVELQAEAMGLPLVLQQTCGEKEAELADLQAALEKAKRQHGIGGVTCGALYSNYQKGRLERVCQGLGLKVFAPLWHLDQGQEMRSLLAQEFEIVFSSVAAEGLDKTWLGRRITEKDIERLAALRRKCGINVAGEGGEFESLVLDCPLFERRLQLLECEIRKENEHTAQLVVKKARLMAKE